MNTLTQRYRADKTAVGFEFTFYCDLCSNGVRTPEIRSLTFDEAFEQACGYARPYFNRCHKCGRWICDSHYNVDEMACVKCAPCGK